MEWWNDQACKEINKVDKIFCVFNKISENLKDGAKLYKEVKREDKKWLSSKKKVEW